MALNLQLIPTIYRLKICLSRNDKYTSTPHGKSSSTVKLTFCHVIEGDVYGDASMVVSIT